MENHIIETDRLTFRPFELSDAQAVLAFSSCPQTTKYTGDAGRVKSLDDAKFIIETIWFTDMKQHGYARLAVVEKQSQQVIGFCGVKYLEDENINDLGYRLLPAYWGKGYASEAVEATLQYAKQQLKLNTLYADINEDNQPSIKLINKFGFSETERYLEDGQHYLRFKRQL